MESLIPHDVVQEIVASRDQALECYERYFGAVEAAKKHLAEAKAHIARATGGEFRLPYAENFRQEIASFEGATSLPPMDTMIPLARRLTDTVIWGAIVDRTQLKVLMDKQAKDELREAMAFVAEKVDSKTGQLLNADDLAKGLPPVSVDNVWATLEDFRARSGEIWRRSIANAFASLDRRFRSHDGFKVGSRIVLTGAFSEWGTWSIYSNHKDTLIDIERVFHVLDGKRPLSKDERGVIQEIDGARGRGFGKRQAECETPYFKVRTFKNGNLHIWFKNDALVDKVNALLAEHYGAALGYGRQCEEEEEQVFSGAVTRPPAKNFGLFPTPDKLADHVVASDALGCLLSSEPLKILEPSAGTGQLSSRLVEPSYSHVALHSRGQYARRHRVTVVEVQPQLANNLRSDGRYAAVHCRDFLGMEADPSFDLIVMNPPFDRGRDIDHVNHALSFLKPGGTLVAIMSASVEFNQGKKAQAFREKIRKMRGHFRDLPEGSFLESGTNVNTVLLSVCAPRVG